MNGGNCPVVCVPGCDCPGGTVLDQISGQCVEDCSKPTDPTCPIQGQVFKRCVDCPDDPFMCADPNHGCIEFCKPGCECPQGQVLDWKTERCVPSEDCSKPTDPTCPIQGQVFKQCVDCPDDPFTCARPPHGCIEICKPGCECPQGQVLDWKTERCVPSEDCSKPTDPTCPIQGQVFKQCVDCPDDPFMCADPNHGCIEICEPGCECPQGQVLDWKTERCVPLEQCS